MQIENALASVAVKELATAKRWYAEVFERPADSTPMPEVAEWKFPRGGWLQVYQLSERAGNCSCTLVVDDLEAMVARLHKLGVDTGEMMKSEKTRVIMINDPDGNSLAFAQPVDPSLAR